MKKIIFLILALFCTQKSFAMETRDIEENRPTEIVVYLPSSVGFDNILKYINCLENFFKTKKEFKVSLFDPDFLCKLHRLHIINKQKKLDYYLIFLTEYYIDGIKETDLEKLKEINSDILQARLGLNNSKVLYFVERNITRKYKEVLEPCISDTFKGMRTAFEKEAYQNDAYMHKNWVYYDFGLKRKHSLESINPYDLKLEKEYGIKLERELNLKSVDIEEIINIVTNDKKDIRYYFRLAKTTGNKKLYRVIANSCYLVELLKKIPVSNSNGQCDTLPNELACNIMQFVGTETLARKKIDFNKIFGKKRKLCNIL